MKKVIHVKIAEVKTAENPDILKATLGSCVGIAFVWKRMNRFALAHCLLPTSSEPVSEIGAKFVSQAIPSLIRLMKLTPQDYSAIEVYVAGGGNMMEQISRRSEHLIGVQNAEAAKKILGQLGITPKWMDLGGEDARQMSIDCETGEVISRKIPN